MLSSFRRLAPWLLAWLVAAFVGALLLAHAELTALREAFETDARIAHRLLSQRVVQHDAVLATLALLGGSAAELRPEERLPSVYPQILSVQRVARLNTLGELAAGMAHELNQPLTAVLANTQAASRVLADEPPRP